MELIEPLASQVEWGARSIAHNLEFIPEDKLDWKPAPTANSAMEVVNLGIGALQSMAVVLRGEADQLPEILPATATTAAAAGSLLINAAQECAAAIRALRPEPMSRMVETPFGPFRLARIALFPLVDLLNRHGQILYIQTLLGDTADHFVPLEP
jgi:hypothetical protein